MYKTRLPFTIVFNKVDVVPADFALEWMADFESFQAALDIESDKPQGGYIHSLTRSLSLSMDEFYNALRAVACSAATGEGLDEIFAAIDDAGAEYVSEYLPELLAAAAERTHALDATAAADLSRLDGDLPA